MGHGRNRCLFTQTTLAVSQLTHENSHLQNARTFQTMLVLHRAHGRVHSTRVFQNSYFNKYTEHQIRSWHGSRARRDETRVSCCSSTRRDQARTSQCVREETKQLRTAPSARTKQKDKFARFDVRGHKLSTDGGRRDVFLFNFGTATNVWFDGLRGISLRAGVPCS